jgi:ABC-type transport system involved in cytochrome c biogenesis permease component
MNYWPLIERELHLGLRRRYGAYKVRSFGAVALMLAACWILFVWSAWRPTAGFGRPFLHLLAALGYLGALLAGVLLSADSLSRERRDGTLDLLLLTHLSSGDVVIGKLLASMVLPLCAFLATVPVLEVSVVLGGATGGQSARLLLVWANALFFSLAAGALASSLCREQRVAQTSALLFVVFAANIPYGGLALSAWTANPLWRSMALLCGPSGLYQLADVYASHKALFWGALFGSQIVSWAFLGLARIALARNRVADAVGSSSQRLVLRHAENDPARAGSHPYRPLLDSSPIQWLAARNSQTPWPLWLWSGLGLALALGYAIDPFGSGPAISGFALLVVIHLVFKLAVASHATHVFAADRRSGALESLLATPVDVREIASAMLANFRAHFEGPVVVLGCASAWAALRLLQDGAWQSAIVLTLVAILLPIDCYCLLWTGLFQGLAARTAALALGSALFQIAVLPWALFFISSRFFWRSNFFELLILCAMIVPINHWWFVTNARTHFFRHFRTLALKPFAGKNPVMESDWSPINWEDDSDFEQGSVQA